MSSGPFSAGTGGGLFLTPIVVAAQTSSWTQLTSVSQVGGTPVDPGSMGTTGTGFNSTTGRATIVWGAHTTSVVGYQNALLRWTYPVTSLWPDFDPLLDSIEIGLDMAVFPHGTVETGIFAGVVDSTTVNASLGGACAAVTQAGAAQDQVACMNATALTPVENIGLCDQVHCTISFGQNSTNYDSFITTDVYLEDGTKPLGPIAQGQTLRSPVSDWQITFGGVHRSTDNTTGTTAAFDVWVRRLRRATIAFPLIPAGSKAALGGALKVVVIGDSIADGVGADPTGDGSNGLAFGGAAVGAGITIYDDGVLRANYQDTAGAGPDPGLLPHIGQTALEQGYTSVTIYRWGVSGNTTSTIRNNRLVEATHYCAANSITPDLVVVVAGSNDSQTGENAAFESAATALIRDIEHAWPRVRTVWVRPIALAAGSYPEADLVRADIDALVAARATRTAVGSTSIGRADDVHPSLQGYRDLGRSIVPSYLSAV